MTMSRTANVFARVEPEIKEQAESVLEQLGIPMSNAVSLNNMPMRHTLYEDEPWHSLGLRYLPVDNYVIYPLAFTPALFPIRKNENTFCCALYVYVETAAWQSPAFFFAQNYNLWEQRC